MLAYADLEKLVDAFPSRYLIAKSPATRNRRLIFFTSRLCEERIRSGNKVARVIIYDVLKTRLSFIENRFSFSPILRKHDAAIIRLSSLAFRRDFFNNSLNTFFRTCVVILPHKILPAATASEMRINNV